MGPGSEVAVRIGKVEGLATAGRLLYVEVAVHLDDNVSGELLVVAGGECATSAINSSPSPSWDETIRLPLESFEHGHLTVSLRCGVPPSEEELAELAFQGQHMPPPLGYVRVPVADLQGLERSRPFTLEGTQDGLPASLTLAFAVKGGNTPAGPMAGVSSESNILDEPDPLKGLPTASALARAEADSDTVETPTAPEPPPRGFVVPRPLQEKRAGERAPPREEGGSGAVGTRGGDQAWRRDGHNIIDDDGGCDVHSSDPASSSGEMRSTVSRSSGKFSPRVPSRGGREGDMGDIGGGFVPPLAEERERAAARGYGARLEAGSAGGCVDEDADAGHSAGSIIPRDRYTVHAAVAPAAPASLATTRRSAVSADGESSPVDSSISSPQKGGALEGHPRGDMGLFLGSEGSEELEADDRGGAGLESASDSSSSFDFSSANPITARDLMGLGGDSRGAGGDGGGGRGGGDRGFSAETNTPEREAARLETLAATVAATVAQVAAETFPSTSAREGFGASSSSLSSSSRRAGGRSQSSTAGDRESDELIGLPIAGSRSPRPALSPAPGRQRRRREANCDEESVGSAGGGTRGQQPVQFLSRKSTADTSGEGFLGGLPLAGSRSPPSAFARVPGRREPDYDEPRVVTITSVPLDRGSGRGRGKGSAGDTSSDGFSGWLPLAGSRSPTRARAPGRRETTESDADSSEARSLLPPPPPLPLPRSPRPSSRRRRQRHRPREEAEREGVVSLAPVPRDMDAVGGSSRSSPPLDLFSSHAASAGGGPFDGEGRGRGRQQRDAEYRAEERLLRSRNRSENSWWDGEDGPGAVSGGLYTRGSGRGEVASPPPPPPRAETGLGTRRRPRKAPVDATTTAPYSSRASSGPKSNRQSSGARGGPVAGAFPAVNATRAAAVAGVSVSGLRSTHFAPGYLGVAWPDPSGNGAAFRGSAVARAVILRKLEEASSRKVAEVEEKGLRARRERAERLRRRNLLLEQHTRREIQEAIGEQEKRLQRQLEAAQRRQAGAEAAAAAAAIATANATSAKPRSAAKAGGVGGGVGARGGDQASEVAGGGRAEAVRRRRVMLQAEEARARVYSFKRKGEVRTQALLRACARGVSSEDGIKIAADAFEAAFEGRAGGGGAGKGPVIAGGAPRSVLESWREQRRAKAEEIRLQAAVEAAFKALEGVAALRRQDAVGARRERARESNARAEEGNGRARKRAKMQAQTAAARLEARARVAAEAAAAATGRGRGRARRAATEDAVTDTARPGRGINAARDVKGEGTGKGLRGRRGAGRGAIDGAGAGRGLGTEGAAGEGSGSLGELLSDNAVGAADGDDVWGVDEDSGGSDRGPSSRLIPPSRRGRDYEKNEPRDTRHSFDGRIRGPSRGGGGGGRAEVWLPTAERAFSPAACEVDQDAREAAGRGPARATEDAAMRRRLEHLDRVAARLEDAEAGIEAKLELLVSEDGRAPAQRAPAQRASARTSPRPWGRRSESRRGGSGGAGGGVGRNTCIPVSGRSGEGTRRRRGVGDADSSRRTLAGRPVSVPRGVGRLAAPTVSSKNKAKHGAGSTGVGGGPGAGAGGGKNSAPLAAATSKRLGGRRRSKVGTRPPAETCRAADRSPRGHRLSGTSGRATAGRKERATRVKRGANSRARSRGARVTLLGAAPGPEPHRASTPPREEWGMGSADPPGGGSRSTATDQRRGEVLEGSPGATGARDQRDDSGGSGKSPMREPPSRWRQRGAVSGGWESGWGERRSEELGRSDGLERDKDRGYQAGEGGGLGVREAGGDSDEDGDGGPGPDSRRRRTSTSEDEHERPTTHDTSSPTWEEGVAWEGTRSRTRYSAEHKETLESVSSEAFRMREIKDDLTAVLHRLRQGDILSAAGAAAAASGVQQPWSEAARGGGSGGGNVADGDERVRIAATFDGAGGNMEEGKSEPKPPHGRDTSGGSRGRRSADKSSISTTASVSLQVSALADLEARIASLGGILDSYSSDCSTPRRASALLQLQPSPSPPPPPPPRSRSSTPPSVRSPLLSTTFTAPTNSTSARRPLSPLPRLLDVGEGGARGNGLSEQARLGVGGRSSSSDSSSSNSESAVALAFGRAAAGGSGGGGRHEGGGGGGSGGGTRGLTRGWAKEGYRLSREEGSSSLFSSPPPAATTGTAAASSGSGNVAAGVVASDLAREVEALLRASGGTSGGSSAGSASARVSRRSYDGDWESNHGSRAPLAPTGDGGRGEGSDPAGWGSLEDMAERLGALAGAGSVSGGETGSFAGFGYGSGSGSRGP